MKSLWVSLAVLIVLGLMTYQAEAMILDCMQIAQDFKCTYMHLQCTDNDNGECSCEDGSICKWKGKQGDDNCPCGGAPKPRRKRRKVADGL